MSYDERECANLARKVRVHTVKMAGEGGCFLGASLSCVDVLVHLYSNVLRLSAETPFDPQRDYFFLSKGHAVPALYGVLAELGFFDSRRLQNHLTTRDVVYWHPNRELPGIEFHSGSLGHGLPIAVGVALDLKIRASGAKVFVMVGDGELNEGTIWESLLVAQAHRLDNLVVVVDRNELQANVSTEELIPLEPLTSKFESFGCEVRVVNGHDFRALGQAFGTPPRSGVPLVVVAKTVRGKGIPSIERRIDKWFAKLSSSEVQSLLAELS